MKIITVKGSDVTNIGLFLEEPERGAHKGEKDIDDIIIQTANSVADSRRQMAVDMNREALRGAEPAVLLTTGHRMALRM